jgi:SAM-dependent methyltransferase
MNEYYDKRAAEYETIYQRNDPVRQNELAQISASICKYLADRRILEVACGTGFWTQVASQVATHVVATDISQEMLKIARTKNLPANKVEFLAMDSYALNDLAEEFNGGLANFWFSHIPKKRIKEFLASFHGCLERNSIVFMADNLYIPGVGGELVSREGSEDTFKRRKLSDGSEHLVLKNYYDAAELREILAPETRDLNLHSALCYWWLTYKVP